jgi:putative holliday junction resolvase
MRILGIDYGDKKIGLAFGDTETRIAVPLEVISNKGQKTIEALVTNVHDEDIDLIVVGVPLATGGHHGPEQLEKTRAFIQQLTEAVSVPVKEEDESYTTSESIRLQREEGTDVEEDALAAMLIIQSYLSRLNETL